MTLHAYENTDRTPLSEFLASPLTTPGERSAESVSIEIEPSMQSEKPRPRLEEIKQIPVLVKSGGHAAAPAADVYHPMTRGDRIHPNLRLFAAEFLGTCILALFGNSVNNQVVLSSNTAVSSSPKGDALAVSWGWGIGIMAGIFVSGGISGGHINPAVTLAMAVFRKFSWWKVPIYVSAQILGAMTGSGLVYANYIRATDLFEGGKGVRTMATAGLYATYPIEYLSGGSSFYEEFLITAIFLFVIFAITDKHDMAPPKNMIPLVLLFTVVGIGSGFGMQTGFALNPARDLGPRLVTWFAGYGKDVWTIKHAYWVYVPVLGPLVGGLFGAFVHDAFLCDSEDSPLHFIRSGKRSTATQSQV